MNELMLKIISENPNVVYSIQDETEESRSIEKVILIQEDYGEWPLLCSATKNGVKGLNLPDLFEFNEFSSLNDELIFNKLMEFAENKSFLFFPFVYQYKNLDFRYFIHNLTSMLSEQLEIFLTLENPENVYVSLKNFYVEPDFPISRTYYYFIKKHFSPDEEIPIDRIFNYVNAIFLVFEQEVLTLKQS